MKKRGLYLLFACVMILTASFILQPQETFAASAADYTGADCTTNKTAASTIDYAMSKYKHQSTFPKSGECWGFAETINGLLAAQNNTKFFTGLKNTQKNFLRKCLGVKAGTHIRFCNSKQFDSWTGHSVVLLKVTENYIYWADNNYDRANTVHYYSGTIDDFFWYYGQYKYLTMVKEPAKYKTYTTPAVSSARDLVSGGIRLTWLKTTNTTRYDVYRSYEKTGTYKRIAKTEDRTFLDASVAMGQKAYYKIKAVKDSGSLYSNIVSNTLKLATPVVTLQNDPAKGKMTLSWGKVERADRYKVYRKIGTNKEKLVKTTTNLTYTAKTGIYEETCRYRVKAVYDANTDGNSSYSKAVYVAGNLNTPTDFAGVLNDDENGSVTLSWKKVSGADCYDLYCCRTLNGTYWLEATIYNETVYMDTLRKPGQQYYYFLVARNSETGAVSSPCEVILI